MNSRVKVGVASSLLALGIVGCVREPEGQFVASPQVAKLDAQARDAIKSILAERFGTPSAPKPLNPPAKAEAARLARGSALYARNCLQCHGVTGDGNGPAAVYLLPRPRDYRPGIFKFTSTTYGSKPLREDLIRTVHRGIAGTSMPAFRLLSRQELEDVVDYVLALTHRGELETELAGAVEFEGSIDPAAVPGLLDGILAKWTAARGQVVNPISPMPVFTSAHVTEGKAAFLSKGCAKCHGDDGRGQTADNIGKDSWGHPTKAADLTSGMLRGGTEPLDIYRHVMAGINGTPMPAFAGAFSSEPETIWKLTAYVLDLANQRRSGVIPEAGMLKPLPGVGETASEGAAVDAALIPGSPNAPQVSTLPARVSPTGSE